MLIRKILTLGGSLTSLGTQVCILKPNLAALSAPHNIMSLFAEIK
jgi:hypothetical protein